MSAKRKVIIAVSVILAAAIIVGGAFLIYIMIEYPYVQKGWALNGISQDDAMTVFGEDSLFVDDAYFDKMNFKSSLYEINFDGRNKTLKDGIVSGYEKKAVSYGVTYQGEYQVRDNIVLIRVNIDYNKEAESGRIESATREYGGYKYYTDVSEKGKMTLTVIKNGHSLEVFLLFENTDGSKDIQLDEQFAESYSKLIMDEII